MKTYNIIVNGHAYQVMAGSIPVAIKKAIELYAKDHQYAGTKYEIRIVWTGGDAFM